MVFVILVIVIVITNETWLKGGPAYREAMRNFMKSALEFRHVVLQADDAWCDTGDLSNAFSDNSIPTMSANLLDRPGEEPWQTRPRNPRKRTNREKKIQSYQRMLTI
jgi:hypothetical protein